MITTILLALALSAAPPNKPPSPTPAPYPKPILRLGVPPWTPEAYDASYMSMLQNARLTRMKNPDAQALRDTETHRMRSYPTAISLSIKKRLYRMEFEWLAAERARRDRLDSQGVVRALAPH